MAMEGAANRLELWKLQASEGFRAAALKRQSAASLRVAAGNA